MDLFADQNKSIWDTLTPILSGQNTTFNPKVMASLDAAAKAASIGQAGAGREAILQDAIRRGLGRSPGATGREIANVQAASTQSYTQAVTQARVLKAQQDFKDKMLALDLAEKHLAQMEQYVLGLDTNQVQREKTQAEIALGYARIAADREMLLARLAADMQIAMGNWQNALDIAHLGNLQDILNKT